MQLKTDIKPLTNINCSCSSVNVTDDLVIIRDTRIYDNRNETRQNKVQGKAVLLDMVILHLSYVT